MVVFKNDAHSLRASQIQKSSLTVRYATENGGYAYTTEQELSVTD